MTNEEILKITAATFFKDSLLNAPLPNGIGMLISDVLKLKDQQFKEYLEKKKEEVTKKMKEHILYSQPEEFYHNRVMFCNEIINELFGGK